MGVRLAARLAAHRERRYNKREARNKKKMAMREARQKKHAKKVLKMNRHKESMKKARKAALSKAKFQRKMEKSNKMKEKAKKAKAKAAAAKKAAEKASKAEAKATKKALAKDAAIKSCPFTGPAMCQNKKKNHKCQGEREEGPLDGQRLRHLLLEEAQGRCRGLWPRLGRLRWVRRLQGDQVRDAGLQDARHAQVVSSGQLEPLFNET